MRITNSQKSQFSTLTTKTGLKLDLFDYSSSSDDNYTIKFKSNYFQFTLKKLDQNNYNVTYWPVNDKNPRTEKVNWDRVIKLFEYWISGISEDVEHSNHLLSIKPYIKIFPPEIEKYSPGFVKIYNQAFTAEQNGLDEICGFGYRKAFEFLMRDYLLKKHPKTEQEKIKTLPIAQCISNYVSNDEIKLVSIRAFWLGNDHAHYIKKWKSKTIEDLKGLISLTIEWIGIKDKLDRVHKAMPKGK